MSDTDALTALKMLAAGRDIGFVAGALGLTPTQVLALADEHGATRSDGSLDLGAVPAAVAYLERGEAIPTREPAPRPAAPTPAPRGGDQLLRIPIDRVRPDPDNPRGHVGDVSELADSLRSVGMLQPIIARQVAGGLYLIVAGHRRHAAARLAGWTHVQVIARRDMRPDDVLAAMLVENSHRKDLDPIEEARGLARLKAQLNLSDAALGRRVGRHQTHVSARLALLALPVEDQEAVRDGAMKIVEATAKARLTAGRVRTPRPNAGYFSAGHPLAPLAKARCRRLHTRVVTMPGGIACGDCWSSVIRADERQHLHAHSARTGTCAVCRAPIDTSTPTPLREANSA